MAMKPVLWGRGSSTNVQKVLWALHELGLEHERRIVGGPHGGNDTAAFLALNPNGTVPVWEQGDFVLWESQAILRHLARAHGHLYGADAQDMAYTDQWLDWSALVFWPPVRLLFLEVFKPGKALGEVEGAQGAIGRTRRNLLVADGALRQIVPDDAGLTIAQISLAIGINRLLTMGYGIALPPALGRWHDDMRARAAFAIATADEPAG